ncbi:hypothetical protein PF002_g25500 [Phytophthora fragariae]|uniref:Secreted protein n=1 Tax=Phytophthora fragariae TaxID=53985 RepID=A0A6A3RDQ0_9STRA|nr:hypothetical protein PF003_g19769 [Phytophthora fragariae]KAE8923612.1 hypothetical protein PF009_g26140 [Phytophthora fragariae]KAE9095342.1 hypothetical protein PF006_g24041 [Phytophthora fragariae]KAE9187773.1 hypothetical protein PF002_g25500 [Phytophthora fragariae]
MHRSLMLTFFPLVSLPSIDAFRRARYAGRGATSAARPVPLRVRVVLIETCSCSWRSPTATSAMYVRRQSYWGFNRREADAERCCGLGRCASWTPSSTPTR